jgi:hypothetical protein
MKIYIFKIFFSCLEVAKSAVPEVAKDGGPAEGAKSGGFGQGRRK